MHQPCLGKILKINTIFLPHTCYLGSINITVTYSNNDGVTVQTGVYVYTDFFFKFHRQELCDHNFKVMFKIILGAGSVHIFYEPQGYF